MATPVSVPEPFPIFLVASKYLLYDTDTISHVRRVHNICGVLIGSLPQVPQQSVFLGLPLQLMQEDARVLVKGGWAFVVDDGVAHRRDWLGGVEESGGSSEEGGGGGLSAEEKRAFGMAMKRRGMDAAAAVRRSAGERREKALSKVVVEQRRKTEASSESTGTASLDADESESLFFSATSEASDTASTVSAPSSSQSLAPFPITPTASPLSHARLASRNNSPKLIPPATPSYPLYAHLHRLGYFMMPGLRFGCQYNVYPGDPLRFHSHFSAVGKGWEEDFRMMEIVSGGRLGTRTKKAFMLGGRVEGGGGEQRGGEDEEEGKGEGEVRTFCVEWAGM